MEETVSSWVRSYRSNIAVRAQLCGVTPEIATMRWPDNTNLTAVEQSEEMVRVVWPGNTSARLAVCDNWLGHDDGQMDIIVGDGCFISFGYPDGYAQFFRKLRESLQPDGMLMMRFFLQPDEQEDTDSVIKDLVTGRITSFHAFKWRLAMSLQANSESGVVLNDIFQAWQSADVDMHQMIDQFGWTPEEIATIELYSGKTNRFTFAKHDEMLAIANEYFDMASCFVPGYELGERCPTIVFIPWH